MVLGGEFVEADRAANGIKKGDGLARGHQGLTGSATIETTAHGTFDHVGIFDFRKGRNEIT
jgi:hypothetical protein